MEAAKKINKMPPMLAQYLEYKEKYQDCLLLFQVGDFYELFFEDAVTVAKTLNLTLTSRDKNSENPVPMCGVPVAVVDGYADRLVAAGYSVSLVSQCSPAKAGKGMVDRKLERIVTPGVRLLSQDSSDAKASIIAAIFAESDKELTIAFCDVQDGQIYIREGANFSNLHSEIKRIAPVEIVLAANMNGQAITRRLSWVRRLESLISERALKFRSDRYLQAGVVSGRELSRLDGYNTLGSAAKKAVRLLSNYIDEVLVEEEAPLKAVKVESFKGKLKIDATTRRNLELVYNLNDGGEEGSLFDFLNATLSSGGYRLLRAWMLAPLSDKQQIEARLDCVSSFIEQPQYLEELRGLLRGLSDLERIAARIELAVVSPRELAALRDALLVLPQIGELLNKQKEEALTRRADLLEDIGKKLVVPPELIEKLESSLQETPPATLNEGGIFKPAYDPELERLQNLRSTGRSWIAELERKERTNTGIQSLKIKFNNVLGYFIEVTKANLDKVPDYFIKRQSMVNAERFFTEELKAQEEDLLGARDKQIALEQTLFQELRAELKGFANILRVLHKQLATLDVFQAFATIANRSAFVCPKIVEEPVLKIKNGRHPIIAELLKGQFVPNSLNLGPESNSCVILTGPNMGGKSTYLRQAALIAVLAQCGSFVPAEEATIGIVDQLFARLGAADDLREGASTFMVEMQEASYILNNATSSSLVLIDEIGRGTATADGLAIAQAILEWLVAKNRSRTLFATHFHELTALAGRLEGIVNLSVGAVDYKGEVVFTHEIKEEAASRSYGIEVAKLANLPAALLKRARKLLVNPDLASSSGQLGLFSQTSTIVEREPDDYNQLKALAEKLDDLNLNNMTPLEALNFLSILKEGLEAE